MNAEEELEKLKATISENHRAAVRRARIQNVVLGLAAVVAILTMFIAFTQNIEINRSREQVILNEYKAKEALKQCQAEAERQRVLAEEQRKAAETAMERAMTSNKAQKK